MSEEESVIRERIAEIDRLVQILSSERASLLSLLYRKSAISRRNEVTNKRSYGRIYNEEKIKEIISRKKGGMSSREIIINLIIEKHEMNNSTLRSYLTRMAQNGHIRREPKTRKWVVEK